MNCYELYSKLFELHNYDTLCHKKIKRETFLRNMAHVSSPVLGIKF